MNLSQTKLFEIIAGGPGSGPHPGEYRGWMSPEGKVHMVDLEHGLNHSTDMHPDVKIPSGMRIKDDSESLLKTAMRQGFTRFSKQNDWADVHYARRAPGGAKSALAALSYMDLPHNANIMVTKRAGVSHEYSEAFDNLSEARAHILKDLR